MTKCIRKHIQRESHPFRLKENSTSPAGDLSSCLQPKKNNDFFTFILTKLPHTWSFIQLALWFGRGCCDNFSDCNFTTRMGPRPPHLSGRTFWSSSMRGWRPAVRCGCSARHSCLPAHLPSSSAGERGSQPAAWLQEATAQPPALGAELLTPPYLSYIVSHHRFGQEPVGEWGEREWAVAVQTVQCGRAWGRAQLFVLSTSIFHGAEGGPHVTHTAEKNARDSA